MKTKRIIVHFLIAIGIMLLLNGIITAQTADESVGKANNLTVVVAGLKSNKGNVIIKLFKSKENYSIKEAEAFMIKSVLIKNRKAEAEFIGLMTGEYAIKLYHDENGNAKHDKNFLGIPKEDYAFSNDAVGTFGPPDYEKAKFVIKNNLIITIYISKKDK